MTKSKSGGTQKLSLAFVETRQTAVQQDRLVVELIRSLRSLAVELSAVGRSVEGCCGVLMSERLLKVSCGVHSLKGRRYLALENRVAGVHR
jgi:hypothetical protein